VAGYPLGQAPAHAVANDHESLRANAVGNCENVTPKTVQRESGIGPVGFPMAPQIQSDHFEIRQIEVPGHVAPGVARAGATPSVKG
jgi:hypothetical protein